MADRRRSLLERTLGVITEVKAGEGPTALLLTLNVFLLLTAYYLIKPVREALILVMKGGAEYKSYMGAAIALALLFAVPAYSRLASRLPRNRLVVGVTLFFTSNLVLFYVLRAIPIVEAYLGLIFFVWVGIFNMMVVAQFWAFANDVYTEEQGKRLFALVGLGASVGAAVGSKIADLISAPLGVYTMLLLAAALLSVCAFLSQVVHVRESRREQRVASDAPDTQAQPEPKPEMSKEGAYALVFKHKYLLLIAIFSLVFTVVNTNGEYLVGRLIGEAASKAVTAARAGATGDIEYLDTAKTAVRIESARYAVESHYAKKGISAETIEGADEDRIRLPGEHSDVVALSFEETAPFLARVQDLEKAGVKHFLVDQDLYRQLESEGKIAALSARGIHVDEASYGYEQWKKACTKNVISAAYGSFYFYVNVLGVLLQMLVVSRLVKYAGFGFSFFCLPVIALADALAFTLFPMLPVIRVGKIAENATDYSLNNTLRQMLWLPTSREMKYKAKQAVDTLFVRLGDVGSTLLVIAGQALVWSVRAFSIANLVLVMIWIAVAAAILREQKRLKAEAPAETPSR